MTDPLIDRIDRAVDGAAAAAGRFAKDWEPSRLGREVTFWAKFYYQLASAAGWVWQHLARPLVRPFWRAMRWAWRKYAELWAWWVAGSRVRGAMMILTTVWLVYAMPNLIELLADTVLYAFTARTNEHVYLTMSQEIVPDRNVHSVRGCETLPCTDQDSIYFRVRPTLFNHAWSLVHHGTIFFPDFVAAAAPAVTTRCVITSYGVRVKLIMRGLDVYPDILAISCEGTVT